MGQHTRSSAIAFSFASSSARSKEISSQNVTIVSCEVIRNNDKMSFLLLIVSLKVLDAPTRLRNCLPGCQLEGKLPE